MSVLKSACGLLRRRSLATDEGRVLHSVGQIADVYGIGHSFYRFQSTSQGRLFLVNYVAQRKDFIANEKTRLRLARNRVQHFRISIAPKTARPKLLEPAPDLDFVKP